MPTFYTQKQTYNPKNKLEAEWETFRDGLNLLKRPTELKRSEYSTGDNIMLIGTGVPTGRWGTSNYFTASGATGGIRGFGIYRNATGSTPIREILALTDQGYIVKKNGTGSTVVTGASYPSGSEVRSEQLGNKLHFVSKDVPMVSYNGVSLELNATLPVPVGVTATNISGVSGPATFGWKITTLGAFGGETPPAATISLPNLPEDLTRTRIRVNWSLPSVATLGGFSIYRGLPGDETFLTSVGPTTYSYDDTGEPASEVALPPITNTTGGIKSPIIVRFNDRFICRDATDGSKLLISGRYPNHTKFNWADGGGYVYIEPDAGQDIIGVGVQSGSNKIVVYKEYSHFALELTTVTIGNYVILDPTYAPISNSIGASTPDTIIPVENDIFYFGRKGLYVTGYEPNFLTIIRTNEISAAVRPYLANLSDTDYKTACAFYVDNKYILSFPARKEMLVYDRERGRFVGIWKLPYGIQKMTKYVDETGTEKWVLGCNVDNKVYTFETSVNSDTGTTITKKLVLNKESFETWKDLKTIEFFNILLRNITGEVNINIYLEDREGSTTNVKTFTITGSAVAGKSGWGSTLWGGSLWGEFRGAPVSGSDEFVRWGTLFKQGRLLYIEVSSTAANSNFEFLGANISAKKQGRGSLSASQRV